MSQTVIALLLVLGVCLVVGSLILRVRSGGKYDVRTSDLVFMVVPLFVVALATGKIKGLDLFGLKADLSALWAEAAQSKIERQVAAAAPATVEDVVHAGERASKGGVHELQQLTLRKVEALEFRLGQGDYYYGPAIKRYFEVLSGTPYLRTLVINNPDGKLFGIYNASDLIGYLRIAGDEGYGRFQQYLNSRGEAAQAELAKLPGFVGVDNAVTANTTKRDALARMEKLNKDSLPVVDERGRFAGTVERARLTASLILAVSEKVESK